MALHSTINPRNIDRFSNKTRNEENNERHRHHEYDEEFHEVEDDLIENYRYLTKYCGALRQSPTVNVINAYGSQKPIIQTTVLRHYSLMDPNYNINNNNEYERSLPTPKQWCSQLNDVNNNTTKSRIPPTIYYDDPDADDPNNNHSFSLIKLFARMKARLKHDKRYRPQASHELLTEEDNHDWDELTKNVRSILTKALVPGGGCDASMNRSKKVHSRQGSCKKARDHRPVLHNDDDDEDDRIQLEIDDEQNTEGNEEFDQVIWNKFLTCTRGFKYRRCGVCKAVDRQLFQGQLVYFYGVANNILIDENLKASGLG